MKKERGRIYPSFATHAQANHRWSITDPAMGQWPDSAERILDVDAGWVEVAGDWDQQELRLLAAVTGDVQLLATFAHGYDIHTIHACEVFGMPFPPYPMDPHEDPRNAEWRERLDWKGKKDLRRVVGGKSFVYSLCYGKLIKNMMQLPGAKELGMTASKIEAAGEKFLSNHPELKRWRHAMLNNTGNISVSGLGNTRVSNLTGGELRRAMLNHKIQGLGAGILNLTVIAIMKNLGVDGRLRWTKHDAISVDVTETRLQWGLDTVREEMEKAWLINNYSVIIPATMYYKRHGGEKVEWKVRAHVTG